MLNKIVSEEDNAKLMRGICPDCGADIIIKGPSGGLSINVLCGECRTEFNASPVQSERLAKPCDPARQREVYHVDEKHYPVASFPAYVSQSRKQLDKKLSKGCSDPDCNCHNKAVTELFLKANCHRDAGLFVSYHAGGFLVLTCSECKKLVLKVLVAP